MLLATIGHGLLVGREEIEEIKRHQKNFLKLIGKNSAELEAKRSENEAYSRPAVGPVDRPVDRCAQTCTG